MPEREPLVVLEHVHPGVLEVRLDRASKRNALSLELLDRLEAAFDVSPDVQVVVLSARGSVFSAGVDVATLTGDERDRIIDARVREVAQRLADLGVPTIAAVDRSCHGAALELLLACDTWVLGEAVTLHLPALRMGLLYDPTALRNVQARLGAPAARRLVLAGQPIRAQDLSLQAIVVTGQQEDGPARAKALEIAIELAEFPASLVRSTKHVLAALERGGDPGTWQSEHVRSFTTPERAAAVAGAQRRLAR